MADSIILKNVRLSFAHLFKKETFKNPDGTVTVGKYAATLLLDKNEHAEVIAMLKQSSQQAAIDKFGAGKVPKSIVLPLKDGDTQDYDGYENQMYLKAASTRKPIIIDQRKKAIAEEDEIIFSGDYVNAKIDYWVQDNAFGKKVNVNLQAIQFVREGERFGAAPVSIDDFEEVKASSNIEDEDFPF